MFDIIGTEKLAPGAANIRLDFAYDGGGPAKGGLATLSVNGAAVAEGRIGITQGGIFSADETADVGIDLGTAVVEAVGAGEKSRFTGDIPRVTLNLK
jgi:arylsulfatase